MSDLVSVIIPTYNNGQFIKEAIDSVLKQTYSKMEIIIVDDGSIDNTEKEVTTFNDIRVNYIKQKNQGVSAARNRGILESHGKFITFLDADDVWMKDKIKKQISALETNEDFAMAYSDYYSGKSTSDPVISVLKDYSQKDSGFILYNLLKQNFINTSTVIIRRDVFSKTGIFDASLKGSEDRNLWIRIARNYKILFVDDILALRRFHDTNVTKSIIFFKNQVYMWSKLSHDKSFSDLSKLIKQNIRSTKFTLAHKLYESKDYLFASGLYLESAINGNRPLYSVIKSLFCLFKFINYSSNSTQESSSQQNQC